MGGFPSGQGLDPDFLNFEICTTYELRWSQCKCELLLLPGRESGHSPPSMTSRMSGAIPPLPQYAYMAWFSV